ncbi:methyl-accepting chemotaxis protein [bacterium]|nr:MAG: methyl-accepting chemotaxis protein [bacterium]
MVEILKKSLTAKIVMSVAVLNILAFGFMGWFAMNQSAKSLREMDSRWTANFTDYMDISIQHYMELNAPEDLQHFMAENTKARGKGLKFVSVITPSKIVKYSSDQSMVGKPEADPIILDLLNKIEGTHAVQNYRDDNVSITAVPLVAKEVCTACHDHRPLGKFLGTTVFSQDISFINEHFQDTMAQEIMLVLVSVIIVLSSLYLLVRKLVLKPLFTLVDDAKIISDGDLTHKFAVDSEDEMGQLATHLATMQEHLKDNLKEMAGLSESIMRTIKDLDSSSEVLVGLSAEQSSGAAEQAAAVHEVTTAAQQIATTSSQISSNVESIRNMATDAFDACIRGRDEVKRAVVGMGAVKDKVKSISEATVELGRKSHKIGGIVSIIDEISEQTHLLALNAAIEAAGAGEHGKRFGVVAAEVRRLAERTVEATAEIKSLIEEIQESTNETVMITERGAGIVLEGTSKVDLIGETLDNLIVRVDQTKEASKEMAIATRQQATAGEQLVITITDINSVAVQVSRAAEKVEKNAMRLKSIAADLKKLTDKGEDKVKFKV